MSSIPLSNVLGKASFHQGVALSPALVRLLAVGAGLTVAALYYAQPMLGVLSAQLAVGPQTLGVVPMLTQLGYALGILLTAPLGDRCDRRTLVLVKCGWLVAALAGAALAPSIGWLLLASFAIGLAATAAQDIVPAAAALAPEARRGQAVGAVMTGLLLGILLSRVVSGFTAEHLGWRTTFGLAAVSVALVALALARGLPHVPPTTTLGYGALLASLGSLWRRHPSVRQAALAQGALAVGFSAIWSTLAMWLHGAPFHMGSAAAGAFGIAGAAGALAAPWFGRLADRHGPHRSALAGACLALAGYAVTGLVGGLPQGVQVAALGLAVIVFDLGFQGALVSHQSLVYSADPSARSRLNALLFVVMFGGMASGAVLAGMLFARWGWNAVVGLAVASALVAVGLRLGGGGSAGTAGTMQRP